MNTVTYRPTCTVNLRTVTPICIATASTLETALIVYHTANFIGSKGSLVVTRHLSIIVEKCPKHLIRADYPHKVFKEAFHKVYHLDRMTLPNPSTTEDIKDEKTNRTFLITTFHPNFKECDKIVERNWDLLDKCSSTRSHLKLDLIKGNRRSKNLRYILVRARPFRRQSPQDH